MSSQIAWHTPESVLYAELVGNLDEMTLDKSIYYLTELITSPPDISIQSRVHILLDMRATRRITRDSHALAHIFAPLLRHSRRGWVLVISCNTGLHGILNKAIGDADQWGYVGTLSEASTFLQRMDPALPPLTNERPVAALYSL
jgi:hypothetical protein